MPVSAAPSKRSIRNTTASDHTAVRRVMQPMATNRATYVMLPIAAATNAGPALLGAPATTAASALAGAIVTRATSEPPSHRPSTICQVAAGESQVKWNVPARSSAPSTASPITSAAIGMTSAKMPSAATLANARSADAFDGVGEQAEQQRAGARQQQRDPTFRWNARLQGVHEDRDEPRSRPSERRAWPVRTPSSDQLPEEAFERVVEGANLDQADRRSLGPVAAGRWPVREPARSGSRDRRVIVSKVTPATDSRTNNAAASRRPSSERTSTCRGRSSMASRIAWRPPAAARRPCISTITRSAIRSTSLSTCELTITVRPWAPELLEQLDEVQPLHRISAVQRFVEHEHLRIGHQCGGDLGALAHSLAEPVDAAIGGVEHRHRTQSVVGRIAIGDAIEIGDVPDQLPGSQPGRNGFVLGHQRHAGVDLAIADAGRNPRSSPCPG